MKKVISILIVMLFFLGLAIYSSLKSGATTVAIDESWTMSSTVIENIEVYGSEQPFELEIIETSQSETTITVEGQVSQSTEDLLKKVEKTGNSFYLPLGQKGFKLVTVADGKDELKMTIELAKGASFKQIYIDTWNGTVDVTVPKTYDGTYDVILNSGAELTQVPDTSNTMDSIIKIDAYTDVSIKKGQ